MKLETRLSKRLYDPRNLEGRSDEDTFYTLRLLEETLKDKPEFVGLDPFGSTMKGYSTPESDIDVSILIDVGVDDIVDNIEKVTTITDCFRNKAEEVGARIQAEKGRTLHIAIFTLNKKENVERVRSYFGKDERDAFIVGSLFRKIKGAKLVEYRRPVIQEILKLDKEVQVQVVKKMAEALSGEELLNMHKAEKRIGESINQLELSNQRMKMWEKHIWSIVHRGES